MQSTQEDKMSKKEITKYVDNLIKANKKSYDKKLAPLLYEFFLRANEKFEWSREEFLEKYQNFRNNVLKIEFKEIDGWGEFRSEERIIFLNKSLIQEVRNNQQDNDKINTYIIDNLFHECLHATDLLKEDGKIKKFGLYHSGNNDGGDIMLNEYANVLSSSLISSDKTMYTDNYGIDFINNGSYAQLKCPGELICATLDITEPQLAKFKDKGADFFYEYLQNKFPYSDIQATLAVFKSSLNVIYNASNNNDKKNISLGFRNMIDAASNLISNRLENALSQGENKKEALERIYYDIYKCAQIVKSVDRIYKLNENDKVYNNDILLKGLELERKVKVYNRFLDNEDLFTQQEKEAIQNGENAKEIIESKFDDDYIDLEFDIEEIVKKYYPQSNAPLNDNTKLIKYLKKAVRKPISEIASDKIIELIDKIKNKNLKLLPLPDLGEKEEVPIQRTKQTIKLKSANFKNSVKYESPIIHDISTEKQEDLRNNKESTRNENEDIR